VASPLYYCCHIYIRIAGSAAFVGSVWAADGGEPRAVTAEVHRLVRSERRTCAERASGAAHFAQNFGCLAIVSAAFCALFLLCGLLC
jgi:hypothetical protein